MCIRDREHYLKAFGRLVEKTMNDSLDKDTLIKLVFLAVKLYPVMEHKGLTMEAVSYTHLDVYKRQILCDVLASDSGNGTV